MRSVYSQKDLEVEQDIGPITWQNLSTVIAQAILNLKEAARQGKQPKFIYENTVVVHRIRILLYVSNCIDKETSPHLRSNKKLRTVHRSLLAAVAKLVLSAKVASNAWRTPESLSKLISDADECLVSVRNFMSLGQDLQLELLEKKPVLAHEAHPTNVINLKSTHTGLILGKPETVNAILLLSDKVRDAITTYRTHIQESLVNAEKIKANAPLFVAQCRNLSNTTSQFLNVIQEICSTQPQDPRTPLLLKAKGPISSSMGALFIVSQTITSNVQDQDAGQKIESCSALIEAGIQQVIEAVQMQVEYTPELPLTPVASTYIGDALSDDHMSEEVLKVQEAISVVSSASVVSASAVSVPSVENTWFLGPEGEASDMVYTNEGNVKGGTLHGLVQHLTQHDQLGKLLVWFNVCANSFLDSKFNTTFLLTYRSFCTTQELFNELFNRYQLAPPEGLKPEEVEMWKEKKLKLVRLR